MIGRKEGNGGIGLGRDVCAGRGISVQQDVPAGEDDESGQHGGGNESNPVDILLLSTPSPSVDIYHMDPSLVRDARGPFGCLKFRNRRNVVSGSVCCFDFKNRRDTKRRKASF